VDIEENRAFQPETIAALQATHGPRLCYCEGPHRNGAPEWAAVLKLPTPGDALLYQAQCNDPSVVGSAATNFFRNMFAAGWTKWDGECDYSQLTKQFPLVAIGCSPEWKAFTGFDAAERSKSAR
jgi:hypothetical protein